MTPSRRAAETANHKADRLAEALEGLLFALSPLTVMGHPIASLDARLSRAINVAVPLVAYARATRVDGDGRTQEEVAEMWSRRGQ